MAFNWNFSSKVLQDDEKRNSDITRGFGGFQINPPTQSVQTNALHPDTTNQNDQQSRNNGDTDDIKDEQSQQFAFGSQTMSNNNLFESNWNSSGKSLLNGNTIEAFINAKTVTDIYRERITKIYQTQDRMQKLEKVLKHLTMREGDINALHHLYTRICSKYNIDPQPMPHLSDVVHKNKENWNWNWSYHTQDNDNEITDSIRVIVCEALMAGYIRNIETDRPVPSELIHLCLQFTQLFGTKHIVFKPVLERHSKMSKCTYYAFQHLSAMPELRNISAEELRYEDLYGEPLVESANDHAPDNMTIQWRNIWDPPDYSFKFKVDHDSRVPNISPPNGADDDQKDSFFDTINALMSTYSQMQKQLSDYQSKLRSKDKKLEIVKQRNEILKKQNRIYQLEMNELKAKHEQSNQNNKTQFSWNWHNTHHEQRWNFDSTNENNTA
eukprot:917548_1